MIHLKIYTIFEILGRITYKQQNNAVEVWFYKIRSKMFTI